MIEDTYSRRVIGHAMNVHRTFGPGLLESACEEFLAIELTKAGIPFTRQTPLAASHMGITAEIAYRVDMLVGDDLVVEIKSVEQILRVHEAQILTYLRLSGRRVALLLNFNSVLLKHGIKRFINSIAP